MRQRGEHQPHGPEPHHLPPCSGLNLRAIRAPGEAWSGRPRSSRFQVRNRTVTDPCGSGPALHVHRLRVRCRSWVPVARAAGNLVGKPVDFSSEVRPTSLPCRAVRIAATARIAGRRGRVTDASGSRRGLGRRQRPGPGPRVSVSPASACTSGDGRSRRRPDAATAARSGPALGSRTRDPRS